MSTKFRRRVGAAADVKELEYISALHQTCMPDVRPDGTVSSLDVVRFLKSRVGLVISQDYGIRIVRGLGGGLVSEEVIKQILKDAKPTEKEEIHKEASQRSNIMDKLRLAESLGALRKRLLHKGNAATNETIEEELESVKEAAETSQALTHVGGTMDDLGAVEPISDALSQSDVDTNRKQEVTLDKEDSSDSDVENPSSQKEKTTNEEFLDLVQIMGILLMPTLARAGKEWHDARLSAEEPQEPPPPPPPTYEGIKGYLLQLYDSHQEKDKIRQAQAAKSLKAPENIIPQVRTTMLKSVHEDASSPPVMDAQLVRKLLIMHGECERAADGVLVDKMVEAACSSSGLFDQEAFVNALTSDLSAWKVGAEDLNTTSFYDAFGYFNYYEKALLEVQAEQAARQAKEDVEEEGDKNDTDSDKNDERKADDKEAYLPKHSRNLDSLKAAISNEVEKEEDEVLTNAAIGLVKEAETEGEDIAKEAETTGVKVVKGAEAGGATQLEVAKKQFAGIGIVKFIDRLWSQDDKASPIVEKDLWTDKGLVRAEVAADRIKKQEYKASHPRKELHLRRLSKKSEATLEVTREDETKYKVDHCRSLLAIDNATDSYSSVLLMVGIFVFFIGTSLTYAVLFQQMSVFQPRCESNKFGCLLVDKIILWCIFAAFFSLVGYCVMIPLSTGNNPVERSPLLNFIAFILALVITWIPYAAVEAYKARSVYEPYDHKTERTVTSDDYGGAQLVTQIVGCIVAMLIFIQFFLAIMGNRRIRRAEWLSTLLLTSVAKGGGRSKRAATRKINRLLQNASSMSPEYIKTDKSENLDVSEEVMINFVIRGERFEDTGGIVWTWKSLFSGYLFEEEGIWIMSRLLVIQTIQALFIGFKTYALSLFVRHILVKCQLWQDNLWPDLPQWVYNFVPAPKEARIALWPAFTAAVLVMLIIFFVYLPRHVSLAV